MRDQEADKVRQHGRGRAPGLAAEGAAGDAAHVGKIAAREGPRASRVPSLPLRYGRPMTQCGPAAWNGTGQPGKRKAPWPVLRHVADRYRVTAERLPGQKEGGSL